MNLYVLGKRIANNRKKLNLTQEKLAEKLNVNVKTISKWETGRNAPDLSVLPALSNTLNISIDELLTGNIYLKNKNKKVICILIILNLFIILLTFIFIKNNEYKVSNITTQNEKYKLDGFIIYNKYNYYLKVNNIDSLSSNTKKVIFFNNNEKIYECDLTLMDIKECLDNSYIKNYNKNKNNFYIVIKEMNDEDEINNYIINITE